jgi:hypothetical protein
VDAGTSQLLSVPYAIYADKAGMAKTTGADRTGAVNSNATHIAGDANYLTKFTGLNVIGKSQLYDNGTNVGIGTASPLYKLHVQKPSGNADLLINTLDTVGAASLRLRNSTGAELGINKFGPNATGTFMGIPRANMAAVNNFTTGPFVFNSGSDIVFGNTVGATQLPRMFIKGSNGFVGFNTTSPSSALDVNGQIRIRGGAPSNGKVLTSDANGTATWQMPTLTGIPGNGIINYLPKYTPNGNTIGNSQLFDNGTNVGIGTVAPLVKLDVEGSIRIANGTQWNERVLTCDSNGVGSWKNLSAKAIFGDNYVPELDYSCRSIISTTPTGGGLTYELPIVAIKDSYAFVAWAGIDMLITYDISNPASPVAIDTLGYWNANTFDVTALVVKDNLLFMLSSTGNKMTILNIYNPHDPYQISNINTGAFSFSTDLKLVGNYAYVVNHDDDNIMIFDVSNPYTPMLVNTVVTGGGPYRVTIDDSLAYVISRNNSSHGIRFYNITSPSNPVLSGIINTQPGSQAQDLKFKDNYFYVLNPNNHQMVIFEKSNAALPVAIDSIGITDWTTDMEISGNLGYVLADSKVYILDLSMPALPIIVDSLTSVGNGDIVVNGMYGYNVGNNQLRVFQLFCPGQSIGIDPQTGGFVASPSAWSSYGNSITNNNSGNVGIGTKNPDQLLSVNGNASKPGGGTWATFSDLRVKQDIKPFKDGLNVVTRLNPVSFRYNNKSGYNDLKSSYVGFLAQEVEGVAPYMVQLFDDTDGASGYTDKRKFDESALTKILVNAIKEQQEQIELLKKEIVEIKALLQNDVK